MEDRHELEALDGALQYVEAVGLGWLIKEVTTRPAALLYQQIRFCFEIFGKGDLIQILAHFM